MARTVSNSKLGGYAGVLSIVIASVGTVFLPIWEFPATTASSAQISSYFTDHRSAAQVMMVFYTVAVTLWMVLGACVWARLRAALPLDSLVPTCFAAGLVGFVTLLLAGFTAFDVLVYRGSVANAQLLYDLAFGLLAMSGMPTAVCLGAFAHGAHERRTFSRFLVRLAAVTAAAHVLLLLSFIVRSGFLLARGRDHHRRACALVDLDRERRRRNAAAKPPGSAGSALIPTPVSSTSWR